MPDVTAERRIALASAVQLGAGGNFTGGPDANKNLIGTANALFNWLIAPVTLVITAGPAVDQTTGQLTGNPGGDTMKDSEKIQLSVKGLDAKGQDAVIGTDITFTSADTAVATIVTDPADGSVWVVAGTPGSTVITADWPDSPSGDLPGTLAVDVTAGNATSLVITAGDPVAQ